MTLAVSFVLSVSGSPLAQPALVERTVAIVAGHAITLSDVRTALALGLIDPVNGADPIAAVTTRLVDRELMLREVQRYAPPEPSSAAVEHGVASVRQRYASEASFHAALESGAFSEARLRAWIRDDLRIAAYLDQRFAAAGENRHELVIDWIADLRRRTAVVELIKD